MNDTGETMMTVKLSHSYVLFLSFLVIHLGVVIVFGVGNFSRDDFPAKFVFGSGTSAYQVEGAAFEDGRTASIWDTFAHAGHLKGANGDVACDGYHKYKEDVQFMVQTGLEAYRFSISWSRLIPNGRGPVNPKGLQFYINFINELVSHGIQPHVTLFHNDLPQALQDEYGGWVNKKSRKDFVAYADVCFREFGDRIKHWSTINEANAFTLCGYDFGSIPPGRCSLPFGINCTSGNSSSEPYLVAHNLLLAHASAVRLYQKKYKATQHGMIGINVFSYWFVPYTNATEDVIATQRANEFYVGWFLKPLVFGDYPDIVKKNAGEKIPVFTRLESKLVKGSFDFLGVNHYNTFSIKDKPTNLDINIRDANADMEVELISTQSDTPSDQFPIIPKSMKELLEYLKHTYGNPPIYIHENGQMTKRNGTLNDTTRVEYLSGYIGSLLDAVRNGSDVRGYFTWSFLDVFELWDCYRSGFGLYYVDLDDKDLRRYPKLSAHWYSNFLKGRNISRDDYIEENIFTSSQAHFSQ